MSRGESLQIEYVDVCELKDNPLNPRRKLKKFSEEYQRLRKSIKDYSYIDPIVWNKRTGYIVSGHQRLQVMKDIAEEEGRTLDKVQVSVVDLDEEGQNILTVALNKVTGRWDENVLEELIGELRGCDYETGFSDYEMLLGESDGEIREARKFTYEEIAEQLCKDIYPIERKTMVDWMINRALAKWQFNRLCKGGKVGENISLLFIPERLNPLVEVYGTESFNRRICERLFVEGIPRTVKKILSLLWEGAGDTDYELDFPPYIARDIYRKYVREGMKVADTDGRFGGKMIGFASCLFEDVDYDVYCKDNEDGLEGLRDFLRLGDRCKVRKGRCHGKYDFILCEARSSDDYVGINGLLKKGGCCVLVVKFGEDEGITEEFKGRNFSVRKDHHIDGFEFIEVRR